jgi:transcriptional regulator with AAA-type ATPase domain
LLDEGVTSVGSGPDCGVCIPDPAVRAVHWHLLRRGESVQALDKSGGGLCVNDEPSGQARTLDHGDRLALGSVEAQLLIDETVVSTRTLAAASEASSFRIEHPDGGVYGVGAEGLRAGTDAGNDVCIVDPYASAHHALFYATEGRLMVRDLGSRNGVFVDHLRVRDAEVPPGASVRMGQTTLRVAAATDASAMVAESPTMRQLLARCEKIARSDAPVLITGETGVGKEVVARWIVAHSTRRSRPLLTANCGALGSSLIESELFGHEKGAFTGALQRKAGLFEAADGGTLFLDEVGELPLDMQTRLLRVLENGEVRRVGATRTFHVDVRILAATHQDLRAGRMREDLYHRLHVLQVQVPPLRDRPDDVAALATHWLAELAPASERVTLADAALARMRAYAWPGNVRELRNTLQRALLFRAGSRIEAEDLEFSDAALPLARPSLAQGERSAIAAALERTCGNRSEAARVLGIARSTLRRKMAEHGL